ncbi:MAG: hypothetical protein ACLP07_15020 [Terracidiphilus sp.]
MMERDLPALPEAAQYVRALVAIEKELTVADRELLAAHWSYPKHAATASELAKVTGAKSYGAVNLRYGRLGKLLKRELNYTGLGQQSYVISWFTRRDGNGDWELHMHPQMAAALEQLGWVKPTTAP